jgi:hypothetical protein
MKKLVILFFALMATTCLLHCAEYVINHCPVTPVREEPSEAAEQATQLLFGELCEVVERRTSWTKIRSTIDGQEGWVSTKMMTFVTDESIEYLKNQGDETIGVVATPMAMVTVKETGEKLMFTIGTHLPNYNNGTFKILGKQYLIDPNSVYNLEEIKREAKGEDVVRVAQSLMNVSYLWGGKNMMGYDCSGFTQTVYRVFGVNLLRNAREQITQGEVVNSLSEAQPGDLVFFDHADRDPKATKISHVGMLISPTEVIHCSGWVHVDKIDEVGIRLANGELTHHLVKIKRYL